MSMRYKPPKKGLSGDALKDGAGSACGSSHCGGGGAKGCETREEEAKLGLKGEGGAVPNWKLWKGKNVFALGGRAMLGADARIFERRRRADVAVGDSCCCSESSVADPRLAAAAAGLSPRASGLSADSSRSTTRHGADDVASRARARGPPPDAPSNVGSRRERGGGGRDRVPRPGRPTEFAGVGRGPRLLLRLRRRRRRGRAARARFDVHRQDQGGAARRRRLPRAGARVARVVARALARTRTGALRAAAVDARATPSFRSPRTRRCPAWSTTSSRGRRGT